MRIVMTNQTLGRPGGTEAYLEALARELVRRGHEVACYSPELGEAAMRLGAAGIRTTDDPSRFPWFPDVALANHYEPTRAFHAAIPSVPIVFTCHGVIYRNADGSRFPEHPPLDVPVRRWVAVSSDKRLKLWREFGLRASLIRNGIDLERFRPSRPPRERPRVLLVLNDYLDREAPMWRNLAGAAKRLGLELREIGRVLGSGPRWDVEKALDDADIVATKGRGALEAMAMGREVLVYGRFGCGGLVRPGTWLRRGNYRRHRWHNFSGRSGLWSTAQLQRFLGGDAEELAKMALWTEDELVAELEGYRADNRNRELARRDYDIRLAADRYLKLAEASL